MYKAGRFFFLSNWRIFSFIFYLAIGESSDRGENTVIATIYPTNRTRSMKMYAIAQIETDTSYGGHKPFVNDTKQKSNGVSDEMEMSTSYVFRIAKCKYHKMRCVVNF